MPLLRGSTGASARGAVETFEWRGVALGAPAQITLQHPEAERVRRVLGQCLDEIARLESIFSLHRGRSELVRLNRRGKIRNPSLDLRILLEQSQALGRLTAGAFDVTVQPLWRLYAAHFRNRSGGSAGPAGQRIESALRRVDYRQLDIGNRAVGFLRPGMAVTLNGIAQGAVTDRIADILRNEGFDRALVSLGELAALDPPANGRAWRVAIDDPSAPGQPLERIDLANSALATSAGRGTSFDAVGRHHHLFDPATGRSASRHRSVSVISPSAALSDALSTALSIVPVRDAARLLRRTGGSSALIVESDGGHRWIRGA